MLRVRPPPPLAFARTVPWNVEPFHRRSGALTFARVPPCVLSMSTLPKARALVLSGAPDVPETYNSVMNAIFSAQKAGVLVDCAVLGESSTFLQQAAYLTGETHALILCSSFFLH